MIDLCYRDFEFADVVKAFGVKATDQEAVGRLVEFVGRAFEAKKINWRVLHDGSVFRRVEGRELFNPDAVIGDMIEFVQLSEAMH